MSEERLADMDEISKQVGAAVKKEEVTDDVSALNLKHAVVMLGGQCRILNEIIDQVTKNPDVSFSTIKDFCNWYGNKTKMVPTKDGKLVEKPVAQIWLESRSRRQYQSVVFDPARMEIPGVYNLYRGLGVVAKQGSWPLMRKHIKEIICNGDDESFHYLLAWMARIVQDPGGERPGVVVVLRGKQGTGKGIFAVNFGKIFGSHFMHLISHTLISGRFNGHLKDKLLIFVDEGFWCGDKRAEGTLKGLITEKHIYIEAKMKDSFPIDNHMNFIFASNSNWVVPAAEEERRFFVMDVSEAKRGNSGYFAKLAHEMNNGGREAMLYDLLQLDISGVNLRAFPRREALFDQILHSWPPEKKFWYEALQAGCLGNPTALIDDPWPVAIDCSELYRLYGHYASQIGVRVNVSDRVFGRMFMELCPNRERKQRTGGVWYYALPPLNQCREDLEGIVNIKISWET